MYPHNWHFPTDTNTTSSPSAPHEEHSSTKASSCHLYLMPSENKVIFQSPGSFCLPSAQHWSHFSLALCNDLAQAFLSHRFIVWAQVWQRNPPYPGAIGFLRWFYWGMLKLSLISKILWQLHHNDSFMPMAIIMEGHTGGVSERPFGQECAWDLGFLDGKRPLGLFNWNSSRNVTFCENYSEFKLKRSFEIYFARREGIEGLNAPSNRNVALQVDIASFLNIIFIP